jgi:hypothetical protein
MSEGFRHPILRTLVFGHFWLALGAAAQVWYVGRFTGAADLQSMSAVAFALVAAYGAMRLVRASEPEPLPSPWIQWIVRHRVAMTLLVLVAAVLSLWSAWGLRRVFAPFDLVAIPLVVLYLVPLQDVTGRSKGLRQIPVLKAPLIAAVWTLATVGLSASDAPLTAPLDLLGLSMLQFSFFFGVAITFDAIDLPHDPLRLRTIPQLMGVRSTRILAASMMLPWMVALTMMQFRDGAFDAAIALPMLGYLLAAVLLLRSGPGVPYWYSAIALDGLLILIPVLAWIGSQI